MRLTVDGEVFEVRERAGWPGQYDFDWVSGPNEGYGFTSATSDGRAETREDLEAAHPGLPRADRSGNRVHRRARGRGRLAAVTEYPFEPKSTSTLEVGHFWPISLSDGSFAAGLVLALTAKDADPHLLGGTRVFVAGLLDWRGQTEPAAESLDGSRLLDWGEAHVKSMAATGGPVLGRWDSAADLNVVRMVSHRGGGMVDLYGNGIFERPATNDEARELPTFGTYGLTFIQRLAERRLLHAT